MHSATKRRLARTIIGAFLGAFFGAIAAVSVTSAQTPVRPAAPSGASSSSPVEPDPHNEPFVLGRRLRVAAPVFGQYDIVGYVDSLVGDVVVLDTMLPRSQRGLFDAGPVVIDRFRRVRVRVGDIREVYQSNGVTRTGATIRYAIIGGVATGVIFGLSNSKQYNPSLKDVWTEFIPGFIVGAVIGGGIGAYTGRERWALIPGPYYLDSPPVGRAP
jgi:hypothetical protein